jgi:di/tricarboxylate transporter
MGISPSRHLIPLSYVSILAGTCTLIGTSTNIIVSDLAVHYGFAPIGMFELAAVGLPVFAAGLLLVLFLSPRLLPEMLNPSCELNNRQRRRYLAEVLVPEKSDLSGLNPCAGLGDGHPGIEVLQVIRDSRIRYPCRDTVAVTPGDTLLVKGSPNDLMYLLDTSAADPAPMENGAVFQSPQEAVVMELIIPPQSRLVGLRLSESDLLRNDDLHVVAVERSGLHYAEKQIRDVRLKVGDILLVWCREDKLDHLRERSDWIMVDDVQHEIEHKAKAPQTAMIFGAVVLAAALGLADIMVCAMAGVFFMTITGCLPLREAYRALQTDVLMLIAGTIALGAAMDKTGASGHYAALFLSALSGWPPLPVLGGVLLLTSIGTQMLSNNATAVLLLPVAISTAAGLGVDPKPFIMAVCFGASACFATPIGYQTNLLVYGPGGYRFSDYLKLGIPLNLLVIVLATVLIPLFWPF